MHCKGSKSNNHIGNNSNRNNSSDVQKINLGGEMALPNRNIAANLVAGLANLPEAASGGGVAAELAALAAPSQPVVTSDSSVLDKSKSSSNEESG
mmetsp:Transcript_25510/g.60353  ORF Transcript_25510/g.60353 Transcript_25510/m.60353 type:complete len:95 (-) Transcript_25510:1658-1942(-)